MGFGGSFALWCFSSRFLDDNKFFTLNIEQFLEFKSEQKIFYINVNEHIKEHLKARKN
ncbi:hypothetical protein VWM73_10985, partial [Campylobacter coli]